MPRYIKHSHGLIIASGSVWGGFSADDNVDWRATVCAEGYHFDNHGAPVIATPAQQLLWAEHPETLDTILHPYMRIWMEKEIGERGVVWEYNGAMFNESEILFRSRADAMKLIKRIKFLLAGMRIE